MRCVFVGTGGFLGRIDGETRCAFWTDEAASPRLTAVSRSIVRLITASTRSASLPLSRPHAERRRGRRNQLGGPGSGRLLLGA